LFKCRASALSTMRGTVTAVVTDRLERIRREQRREAPLQLWCLSRDCLPVRVQQRLRRRPTSARLRLRAGL
jgi:hypothetical protein